MRFALMTEPQQGLGYDDVLALAQAAERAGFESFFRSDHYASFPGDAGLPTTDAWTTLAGVARETSRITFGTLVSPMTFRVPGTFAKIVATVDEMSGGRVEVGMGAGWNELEHRQHGIPFPATRERFDILEESLAVVHGLWTEPDGWRYDGRHFPVEDSRYAPRPVRADGRRHPPIIIGGELGPRMARLVATYGDEANLTSATPERAADAYERVRAACRTAGRDPGSLVYSAMTGALVARDDAELAERVAEQLRIFGRSADEGETWLAERRGRWVTGTPDEARERVRALEEAGVERLMLQVFLPRDLEMVTLLGEIFLG